MSAVSFQHVSKTFDSGGRTVRALQDVSFDIEEGEFFGLLGPNGAGKTTLISILAGLSRASAGRVTVQGHDVVSDYAASRRALGVVPQELVFDPFFSVRETLRNQSAYFGLRRNDDLPGSEAPAAFLSWVRDRTGPVDRVLEHNRLDVLSLVALLGQLAGRAVGLQVHPRHIDDGGAMHALELTRIELAFQFAHGGAQHEGFGLAEQTISGARPRRKSRAPCSPTRTSLLPSTRITSAAVTS